MQSATLTNLKTKKIWSARVVGWLTLICGPASGLFVAAVNWLRMGYKAKGIFHLLLSIAFGFLYAFVLQDYVGLSRHNIVTSSISEHIYRLILNFSLIFVVLAYLYTATNKDIKRLQELGAVTERAGILGVIGIAVIVAVCFNRLNDFVIQSRLEVFQNHVYCELLRPGMSDSEVSNALAEVGPHTQVSFGYSSPQIVNRKFASFRTINFKNFDIELKYQLQLGLGYDENDKLVWISRYENGIYQTVQCPWSLW